MLIMVGTVNLHNVTDIAGTLWNLIPLQLKLHVLVAKLAVVYLIKTDAAIEYLVPSVLTIP
jgi:hypothetical protein